MEKDKVIFQTHVKDRENKFKEDIKMLQLDIDRMIEEYQKLEKQCKQMQLENQKLKNRIVKMTFKKGKNDRDIKICKNCHKEYYEKENFNWSCRTHHYQFNGEFYWCCGKRGEDQIGCKVSKHECKDDEDEEDAEEKKKDKERQLKYMKCMCCKELGHSIENCNRDPNIKTLTDPVQDEIRVMEIKDNRTLFAETVIQTTHLLKKCARV